jgi:nucleoside-diphosphate-sugar epimerase
MRVLLAGATGALGRRLPPKLIDAGHEVVGTTRSPEKLAALAAAGADGIVMDGPRSLRRQTGCVRPAPTICLPHRALPG